MTDTDTLADEVAMLIEGIGDTGAVARELRRQGWHGTPEIVERLPAILAALRAQAEPVAKRPWCETCGKDVHEVLCPTCAKWWNDNPPPTYEQGRRAGIEEAAKRICAADAQDWDTLEGSYNGRVRQRDYIRFATAAIIAKEPGE